MVGHGQRSCLERLPCLEPRLTGHHLLGVAKLERRIEDLTVGHVLEARQQSADLSRHRMMAFAMPTHIELGLLTKVLEIGHGRTTVDVT